MFTFNLTHAGVYRQQQASFIQTINCPWINLHISGMKRVRLMDSNIDLLAPGPFLSLGVPGTRVYFETVAPRENYVLMLDGLHLRHTAAEAAVELAYAGAWISLPGLILLTPERLPSLVLEFRRVVECFRNPLPANRLEAHLTIASILRRFIEHQTARPAAHSPAAVLRQLLDDDSTFVQSLPELARRCGYSADHMRALFRREYGISPLEYRNKRRLAVIMDLVAKSTLSAKEIAARTGFQYLSYFSAFFRQHSGISPRQAITRFRQPPTVPSPTSDSCPANDHA